MGNWTCSCETKDLQKEEMSRELQLTSKSVQVQESKVPVNQFKQQNQETQFGFNETFQTLKLPATDYSDLKEPRKTDRNDYVAKMVNQECQYEYQEELDQNIQKSLLQCESSIEEEESKQIKKGKILEQQQKKANQKNKSENNDADVSTQAFNIFSPEDQKKIEKLLDIYNKFEKNIINEEQKQMQSLKNLIQNIENQKDALSEEGQDKIQQYTKQELTKEKIEKMLQFYTQMESEQSSEHSIPAQMEQNGNRYSLSDKGNDSLKYSSEFNVSSPAIHKQKITNQDEIRKEQTLSMSPLQSIDFRNSSNSQNNNFEKFRQQQVDQEIQTLQIKDPNQERYTQTPSKIIESEGQTNSTFIQKSFLSKSEENDKNYELQKSNQKDQQLQADIKLQQFSSQQIEGDIEDLEMQIPQENELQEYQFQTKHFKGKGIIQNSLNQEKMYENSQEEERNSSLLQSYQNEFEVQRELSQQEESYKVANESENEQSDIERFEINQVKSQQLLSPNNLQLFKDLNMSPIHQQLQCPVPYPDYRDLDIEQSINQLYPQKKEERSKQKSYDKSVSISNQGNEHQVIGSSSLSYEICNQSKQNQILLDYDQPENGIQNFSNEIIIYEGYLLKYKPGPSTLFIKRCKCMMLEAFEGCTYRRYQKCIENKNKLKRGKQIFNHEQLQSNPKMQIELEQNAQNFLIKNSCKQIDVQVQLNHRENKIEPGHLMKKPNALNKIEDIVSQSVDFSLTNMSQKSFRSTNQTFNNDPKMTVAAEMQNAEGWSCRELEWYEAENRFLFASAVEEEINRWVQVCNWLIKQNSK